MFDIDDTIDAFRRGTFDFDCKRMVLAQRKNGGERFEGQGYIRQSTDGTLVFKIYVTQRDAEPFGHLKAMMGFKSGEIYSDDAFYDLDATGHDGTRWTATRILPTPHWDASDTIWSTLRCNPSLHTLIWHNRGTVCACISSRNTKCPSIA
jgi:hypothetical protein